MSKQIKINSDINKVNLEDVNPKIVVKDNNRDTSVNVEVSNTKIVTVATVGPRGANGPAGSSGPSGSVGPSGSGGFPYSGSDAQFGTPPQAIITGSLLLSGSGHITASGYISASGNIIGAEFTSSKGILINSSISSLSQNPFLIKFDDGNGQPEKFSVSSSGVVRWGALDTLPTPITGGLVYSASNFYMGL